MCDRDRRRVGVDCRRHGGGDVAHLAGLGRIDSDGWDSVDNIPDHYLVADRSEQRGVESA